MRRWTEAPLGAAMLEVETRNRRPDAATSYRLTALATRRLEDYLATSAIAPTDPA